MRRKGGPLDRTKEEEEAGGGNRTLVISLEGWGSTIELHPRATDSIRRSNGLAPTSYPMSRATMPANRSAGGCVAEGEAARARRRYPRAPRRAGVELRRVEATDSLHAAGRPVLARARRPPRARVASASVP